MDAAADNPSMDNGECVLHILNKDNPLPQSTADLILRLLPGVTSHRVLKQEPNLTCECTERRDPARAIARNDNEDDIYFSWRTDTLPDK